MKMEATVPTISPSPRLYDARTANTSTSSFIVLLRLLLRLRLLMQRQWRLRFLVFVRWAA